MTPPIAPIACEERSLSTVLTKMKSMCWSCSIQFTLLVAVLVMPAHFDRGCVDWNAQSMHALALILAEAAKVVIAALPQQLNLLAWHCRHVSAPDSIYKNAVRAVLRQH